MADTFEERLATPWWTPKAHRRDIARLWRREDPSDISEASQVAAGLNEMTTLNEMQNRDAALDEMREALTAEQLRADLTEGSSGEAGWLQVGAAPDVSYRWSLWFYSNGERHIYATLWPESASSGNEDDVVWYHPFELEDYRSASELETAFRTEALQLLRSFYENPQAPPSSELVD